MATQPLGCNFRAPWIFTDRPPAGHRIAMSVQQIIIVEGPHTTGFIRHKETSFPDCEREAAPPLRLQENPRSSRIAGPHGRHPVARQPLF